MEPNEPARSVLADLSFMLSTDNEKRDVDWTDNTQIFGCAPERLQVLINPWHNEMLTGDLSGEQEFALLVNTLSHEVEHTLVSNLNLIEDFVDEYDDRPRSANIIMNTIEDVYIDKRRTDRKRGLRRTQSLFAETYVRSSDPIPEQDEPVRKYLNAFRQVALAGYAKELSDSEDEVREWCARARPLIDEARNSHSSSERERIAHELMDILDEYVDEDAPEDMEMERGQGAAQQEEGDQDGEEQGESQQGQSQQGQSQQQDGSSGQQGDEEEEEGSGGGGDDEEEESDEEENGSSGGEDGDDEEESSGGDEQEEGDQDGDSGKSFDIQEVEAQIEQMEEAEAENDAGDWNDVDGGGYRDPANFVKKAYKQIQHKQEHEDTEIGRRQSERDEKLNDQNYRPHWNHERIVEEYSRELEDSVAEAFRQIKTRDRPKPAEHGIKVNVRGVIRRKAGDPTEKNLYLEEQPSEAGDRCITVAVDGSGSMDEREAKLALLGLARACEQIGDRFVAVEYHTTQTRGVGEVKTDLITAPDEDFQNQHLDSFTTGGLTPTAHGIKDARNVSDEAPNFEDVVIVITDGAANVDLDGNQHDFGGRGENGAIKDAAVQVNSARAEGKRVIGLGVGREVTPEMMDTIFGDEGYVMCDMDNLAQKLLKIYRDQMETTN